ncbi:MAG: hypothetical protein P8Z00_24650 [Anaerolineales bacterium]|jgi:hypothetical protein
MAIANSKSKTLDWKQRADVLTLWGGVLFSLVFTAVIWLAGSRLATIPHLPDQGAAWYYWKLPEPDLWARITSWGFYLLHQVISWGLILYAQRRVRKYTTGLQRINVIALAVNAVFILLHLVQTHLWYDGLAQDVSIWSSQASVIVLLVWVLLMENSRRGLFFGKKAPISKEIMRFARQYHGYFFSWAIIYTFWFHPMEPTSGHLIGFFYMFLLMLQGSLFYTRVHLNRVWTTVLEVLVLFHGALVAVMNANNLWPMFAFGFAGIFVITQMHGLKLPLWVRGVILSVYIGLAIWVYGQQDITQIHQVTWIPFIEYLSVFLLAGIFSLGLWLAKRVRNYSTRLEPEAQV